MIQLNKHFFEIRKSYVSARPTSNYTIQADSTVEIIPFGEVLIQEGDKLSVSPDGKITIGSGVSRVKVSVNLTKTPNTTGFQTGYIMKNSSTDKYFGSYGVANQLNCYGVSEWLMDVVEGDVISIGCYGYAGESFNQARCYLYIEVIK